MMTKASDKARNKNCDFGLSLTTDTIIIMQLCALVYTIFDKEALRNFLSNIKLNCFFENESLSSVRDLL